MDFIISQFNKIINKSDEYFQKANSQSRVLIARESIDKTWSKALTYFCAGGLLLIMNSGYPWLFHWIPKPIFLSILASLIIGMPMVALSKTVILYPIKCIIGITALYSLLILSILSLRFTVLEHYHIIITSIPISFSEVFFIVIISCFVALTILLISLVKIPIIFLETEVTKILSTLRVDNKLRSIHAWLLLFIVSLLINQAWHHLITPLGLLKYIIW